MYCCCLVALAELAAPSWHLLLVPHINFIGIFGWLTHWIHQAVHEVAATLCRAEGQAMQGIMQLSLEAAESKDLDQPSSNDDGPSYKDNGKGQRKCTCKKTRCLKLYCECFAAGKTTMHVLSSMS